MSEESRKEKLKELIKKLHEGGDIAKLKEEFKKKIGDVTPREISKAEEELIKEGMEPEKIHKLCDLHISLMKESLDKEKSIAPPGHPIHTLMEEHKKVLQFADELKKVITVIKDEKKNAPEKLKHIEDHLRSSESHYVREENVLFPYLEKHGIKQPPKMMWMDHDQIRELKKKLYNAFSSFNKMEFSAYTALLEETAIALAETLANHFYKENNILFPAALQVISEEEWAEIKKEFDELGYCCFTPGSAKTGVEKSAVKTADNIIGGDMIEFETGAFNPEELEMMLNSLPVDITFVDKEDTVRYFNQAEERIFPRTKAVIGRKVQNCHPQKSVHVVNKILDDFKKGTSDKAEFWITLNNRLIYIRYFPVRNREGRYLGCLEVTQDITEIKKIEGEKRLL